MASLAGDDSIIKLKMGDIRKRFGRRRRTGDFGFNGIHNQSLGILGSIESNSTKWFFQHWMHEKTNESHEKMLPLGIQGTVYLIQKANERLGRYAELVVQIADYEILGRNSGDSLLNSKGE